MHITHTYTVQLSSSRFGEKTPLRVSIRHMPALYGKSKERAQWKRQNLHDWKEKHVSVPHLNAAGDELQQNVVFVWRQKGLRMNIWPFTVESTELSQLCSHPKGGPMIILRHAALSDFLLRWRRLAYVRSGDYFCTLTSYTVHNVTALRGICTKHDKIKGSNTRGLSVGLPAWKMGNCHQGREESSSNPPGICLL